MRATLMWVCILALLAAANGKAPESKPAVKGGAVVPRRYLLGQEAGAEKAKKKPAASKPKPAVTDRKPLSRLLPERWQV